MPPKRKRPGGKSSIGREKKKQNVDNTKSVVEVAEVSEIVDERGGDSKRTGGRRQKHEYLCRWLDGADAQWVAAEELEGSPAVEDWEWREDARPEQPEEHSVVDKKCQILSRWIREARRPVFLLGAGISAPVLPTFRGAAGLWTRQAHLHPLRDASPSEARPTLAHRALAALERVGCVYWVATQNYDDLSRKSGFPGAKLSELHGNMFKERCGKCGSVFHRDFEVANEGATNHETGRRCEECGGHLRDTIVHFGEDLPWHELKMANAKFCGSDLAIVLGSSLRVEPAASLPFKAKRRQRSNVHGSKRAVIINLQSTRQDDGADMLIRASCDQVMDRLAKDLVGELWDIDYRSVAPDEINT